MKFGFGHVPAQRFDEHVRLVQLAESVGYDHAWIPDQTFHRDPIAIIAAVALGTSRIGLGLGVANPFTRHPATLARAAATLDEISNGRFSLGIGAGNRKELLRPLGLDEGDAARRCREMVEVVRVLLSGKPTRFSGKYFQTDGVKLDFDARPDLPIYIAGRGPMILVAAGAVADGTIVGGLCTPRGIAYALDHIRSGAAQSGRNGSRDVVSWVTCYLTHDRAEAVRNLRPVVAHIIGGAPDAVLRAAGLAEDEVGRIKSVYQQRGSDAAGKLVPDHAVDAFAIVGDEEECAGRIADLGVAGVTEFAFLMPPGDVSQHAERLRSFAAKVMPLVAVALRPRQGSAS